MLEKTKQCVASEPFIEIIVYGQWQSSVTIAEPMLQFVLRPAVFTKAYDTSSTLDKIEM